MKKLLLFLLLATPCFGQFTSTSATITDSDSIAWANGTWQAQLYYATPPTTPPTVNGVPLTAAQMGLSGTLNGSGTFTTTLADNLVVRPAGSQWQFTICPQATFHCTTGLNLTVTGSSISLTTALSSAAIPPRLNPTPLNFAYSDLEVAQTGGIGGVYYNSILSAMHCWTGTAWITCSGSGGGGGTITPCTTGTSPTGTPGISQPLQGATGGLGNCITYVVQPESTDFITNLVNGVYAQELYNPLSYNNGNVTGGGGNGEGFYNALGDCTANNSITPNGLSGTAGGTYIKPCWLNIEAGYQFFTDGGTGYFGSNPVIVPPSVYDANISTYQRYFHNSEVVQNADTMVWNYNNPGMGCPFPLFQTNPTYYATSNCASGYSPWHAVNFNFTAPLYTLGTSGPGVSVGDNHYGMQENYAIYEGGHNENSAGNGRYISNVATTEWNFTRNTNAQFDPFNIYSTLGGGGDHFLWNYGVQVSGRSSGNDQGIGKEFGYIGSLESPFTVTSTSSAALTAFRPPSATAAAYPQVLRFTAYPVGPPLASGVNNDLMDMGPKTSRIASHAYAVSTASSPTSITDSKGNTERVVVAGTTSSAASVTWPSPNSFGAYTTDGSVVWQMLSGPAGGYALGNILNIGTSTTAGEIPLAADSTAAWSTLFGTSGNTTWYILQRLPYFVGESTAIPATGGAGTPGYWGCQSGTPSYSAPAVVGTAKVPQYPIAAFCYQISGTTPPAIGSQVQITDATCSETATVLFSDYSSGVSHMVATASCQHAYGPVSATTFTPSPTTESGSVIYQGPGVGLGLGLNADTAGSFTATPSQQLNNQQQVRPISRVDNAGHVWVWDFYVAAPAFTGKAGYNYIGNSYICSTGAASLPGYPFTSPAINFTACNNDVQPVLGAPVFSGTSLISIPVTTAGSYRLDNNKNQQHWLQGLPVTFTTGGTAVCNPFPTAHYATTYSAGITSVTSVVIDTPGTCTTTTGFAVVTPTSTLNPYYIAPMAQVTDLLTPFSVTNYSNYVTVQPNANNGIEIQTNPYQSGTYSATPFLGISTAFASGDYLVQPPLIYQTVTDNSQMSYYQAGVDIANRTFWQENIGGTPPVIAGQVNVNASWSSLQVLSPTNMPQGAYTTEYCALPWKPGTVYPANSIVQGYSGTTLYIYINNGSSFTSSSTTIPAWPSSGTVADNGGTWTWDNSSGTNARACPSGVTKSGVLTQLNQGGSTFVDSTLQQPTTFGLGYGGEATYKFYMQSPPVTANGEGSMVFGSCWNANLNQNDTHPCINGLYEKFGGLIWNDGQLGLGNAYGNEFDPTSGAQNFYANGINVFQIYGNTTTTGTATTYPDTLNVTSTLRTPLISPGILYRASGGTALPACNAAEQGYQAVVSDATSPTFMGAYAGGGAVTATVLCSYNGTTYGWVTH